MPARVASARARSSAPLVPHVIFEYDCPVHVEDLLSCRAKTVTGGVALPVRARTWQPWHTGRAHVYHGDDDAASRERASEEGRAFALGSIARLSFHPQL